MKEKILIEGIPAINPESVKKKKIFAIICFVTIFLIPLGLLFLFNIKSAKERRDRTKLIVTNKNVIANFGGNNDQDLIWPIETLKEALYQKFPACTVIVTTKGAYAFSNIANHDEVVKVINELISTPEKFNEPETTVIEATLENKSIVHNDQSTDGELEKYNELLY